MPTFIVTTNSKCPETDVEYWPEIDGSVVQKRGEYTGKPVESFPVVSA